MRTSVTPFCYAVDNRDGRVCEMDGCTDLRAYTLVLQVKQRRTVNAALCHAHMRQLRETAFAPHGERQVTA